MENGYLITPEPVQLQDISVKSLIDAETRHWDVDILNDICEPRDRELIKRIPIPTRAREDLWFWMLEDKGQFTVESYYRRLHSEQSSPYAFISSFL